MFSRRRSRSHYDPQQYNAGGIRQPRSASASAAANAFYQRQLGPSAAAEALRRHSLDQNGADAIRDFHAGGPPGAAPRRANSLTTRSYQVVHTTPNRTPSMTAPRQVRTPSYGRSPSLSAGGPVRRNSLSSDRSNSLTRTHTVVNKDAHGRTLSLTTTTIRQMGSFELVSTKDVPIASPSRHVRQQPSFNSDFGSRTNSLHSLDSELVGIQEEPEEDAAALRGRLDRLGDPIDEGAIPEAPEEEESEEGEEAARDTTPVPSQFEARYSQRAIPQTSANPQVVDANAEDAGTVPRTNEEEAEHESEDDTISASSISDTTPSPASARAGRDELPPAVPSEPLHREVSPVRSALKNGQGATPKTKVSFGGTEEPYVYESYEYEEDHTAQPPGVAAASAAARSRQSVPYGYSTTAPSPGLGASAAAANSANSRRRLVLSQPALHVEKRPSQTSLSGRSQATAVPPVSSNTPYPHARPWDVQHEQFVDAPQSIGEIPVPERSAARRVNKPAADPRGPRSGLANTQSALGSNGLRKDPDENIDLQAGEDPIRSQAIALAQAAFRQPNQAQNLNQNATVAEAAPQPTGPSHHYRSLLEDDSASIRSESSFTRERNTGASKPTGSTPGRMRSLRQPATPTLRNNNIPNKKGRKLSLLNQNPPNLDMGAYSNEQTADPGLGSGFRTFSLRNTQRPDPSTLLAGNSAPQSHKSNDGGGFRSRFADSDSDDDVAGHVKGSKKSNANGKLSLGDMFSPSTDVKDIFKGNRATSDSAVVAAAKPRKKNGFFKRVFGKKDREEVL